MLDHVDVRLHNRFLVVNDYLFPLVLRNDTKKSINFVSRIGTSLPSVVSQGVKRPGNAPVAGRSARGPVFAKAST